MSKENIGGDKNNKNIDLFFTEMQKKAPIVLKTNPVEPQGDISRFVEINKPVLNRNDNVKDAEAKVTDLTKNDILALVQWYKKSGDGGSQRSKDYSKAYESKLTDFLEARKKSGTASESEMMRAIAGKYKDWVRSCIVQHRRLRSSKALGFFLTHKELCLQIEIDYQILKETKGLIKSDYRPINLTSFMCEMNPKEKRTDLSDVCNYLSDIVPVNESRQHKYISLAQVEWNSMWKSRLGKEDEAINKSVKNLKQAISTEKAEVRKIVENFVSLRERKLKKKTGGDNN